MRFSTILTPLFAAAVVVADFTLDTQAINQCKDVTFNIGGAQGKVTLTILPSDNPCDHAGLVVKDGFSNGQATLKNVNIPAGTSVIVVADDESDKEAWSGIVTVGGNAADCASSSSAGSSSSRAAVVYSTPSTSRNAAGTAPANAASATDTATSGASPLKASWGFGVLATLAALIVAA